MWLDLTLFTCGGFRSDVWQCTSVHPLWHLVMLWNIWSCISCYTLKPLSANVCIITVYFYKKNVIKFKCKFKLNILKLLLKPTKSTCHYCFVFGPNYQKMYILGYLYFPYTVTPQVDFKSEISEKFMFLFLFHLVSFEKQLEANLQLKWSDEQQIFIFWTYWTD